MSSKIKNCPAWWSPSSLAFPQAKNVTSQLSLFLSPIAFSSHPVAGAVVYGAKGTCKTSGALGLLDEWANVGMLAEFQDFSELMLRCRSAWKRDSRESVEQILLGDMMKPRVLLLDDLGKRSTPEDQEYSGILLKGRHDRGLATICTTNHDLKSALGLSDFLSACDDRGADRFANCFVEVTGRNVRRAA